MRPFLKIVVLTLAIFTYKSAAAQLQITPQSNAQALVQKLLGTGVTVSNIKLTGSPLATGFFNNISGTNIGLDSGIVLTNGRVVTNPTNSSNLGLVSDNGIMAYTGLPVSLDSSSTGAFASTDLFQPGDLDLEALLGNGTETNDATVLEFDFVPLGDTIRFRYVFSSEEYPTFPCQNVNDAFAFFIRGPGYPGNTNIALIPGTTAPVTIDNINYLAGCGLYPQFYLSNRTNKTFTHNGHTTIFTAIARVTPCQKYHLKLVIADVTDGILDSGVFLEAKSLSSNTVSIENTTQVDLQNNSYLVEGCSTGSFKIKRPLAENTSLPVALTYAGTAINGVDMQLLPNSVIIQPNQTFVTVNVLPLIDNMPEGIETIKIYAFAGNACGVLPTDSTVIQLRDYDTLGIQPDTAIICKNNSIQLVATTGYSNYQWDAHPTLSNTGIRNPVATPVTSLNTYYCTSTEGTCHGRDSALVSWKALQLLSVKGVNCKDGTTGEIKVAGGAAWERPAQFAIGNAAYQNDSTFSNLPVGTYWIKIKDVSGCIDSIPVTITQLFPDLLINNTSVTPASCSGNADGTATITVTGGKSPYLFSADGISFQSSNVLQLVQGTYIVTVKDNNNCTNTTNIFIPLNNTVIIDAGPDTTICEGKSAQLAALSNAVSYSWAPSLALNNNAVINPVASPVQTIQYFVTATTGICTRKDSINVFVNSAPKANAGPDSTICFGQDIQLSGAGGTSYFWYPSSYLNNTSLAKPTAKKLPGSISYFLSVIDAKGCVSLKKDTILVTVTRPALVYAGKDTTVAVGQPLQLAATDVNHIGFNQYEWMPVYGLNNASIAAPIAILDKSIIYTVTAKNAIGCLGTDNIKVTVYAGPEIYVPNAFSPNGNNLNDILRAIPAGIKHFHYFRIYNRWGNLVFSTDNPLNGWDGTFKSAMQTSGTTFVWMAEGEDYRGNLVQRKGTVMIIK